MAERLKNLSLCYKCLILVADSTTLDGLLGDAHYKATFGALEYLPGLFRKLPIREFFELEVKFK